MLPGQLCQKWSLLPHDQKRRPPGRVRPGPDSSLPWVLQRIPKKNTAATDKGPRPSIYCMKYNFRSWMYFIWHTWIRLPGDSSLVSMTNLDPYQKAKAKQRKIMHHKYPWKMPMMEPFLIPQLWASARFLSYLYKLHIFIEFWIIEEWVTINRRKRWCTFLLLFPRRQTLPPFWGMTGPRQPLPLPSHRPWALGPSTWPQPSETSNTSR